MKRTLLTSMAILAISSTTFMVSCKKNAGDTEKSKTLAAETNAIAESQYNDVTTIVDQAALNSAVLLGAYGTGGSQSPFGPLGSNCVSVTVDTSANPRTITIDFGTSNCLCLDGRMRRGKILATYTGQYRQTGTVVTISLDNYYVNEYKIGGTKKITNQGLNNSGNLVYKVEVTGEVTRPGATAFSTWVSTRYREWKQGYSTPLNILDDVYTITGDASGILADGSNYSLTITSELVRKMNCQWFESGKIDLTETAMPKITLDYGSTGCDGNATVTILGQHFPIVLQ